MEQIAHHSPPLKSRFLVKNWKNWTHILLKTPTIMSLIIGLFLVVYQYWAGSLSMILQVSFFGAALILTGIPHGALDHLVEKETAKRYGYSFKFSVFISKYLLTMLFYGVFWYFLPSFSLFFFLLISAWHFGETDLEKAPFAPLFNLARFTFGSFVLLFLLTTHAQETGYILTRISQKNEFVAQTWLFFLLHQALFLIGLFSLSILFIKLGRQNKIWPINHFRYIRLGILLILTYFLPLLPAFALYFAGWHALCSFKNTHDYLVENKSDFTSNFQTNSFLKLWSKTLFFTILAFVFLVAAVGCWFYFLKWWDPLPVVFIFLSIITLPHLNIMHRMDKNAQNEVF